MKYFVSGLRWTSMCFDYRGQRACVSVLVSQWRKQKIFMGGISLSGIWWSFVFGVRCLWRHNLTSYSCFQTKFVGIICIYSSTRTLLILCHCTESKLSALQVRISEENTLNTTTQKFITAEISGCAFKQGSKTHSLLRQSNLQLQNQATLIPRWIRAVEHRCAPGLAGAHPGLQDLILLSYTRIKNAHKVRKKTFVFFVMHRSPATCSRSRRVPNSAVNRQVKN